MLGEGFAASGRDAAWMTDMQQRRDAASGERLVMYLDTPNGMGGAGRGGTKMRN